MDTTWLIPGSVVLFLGIGRIQSLRRTQGGSARIVRNGMMGLLTYSTQKILSVPMVLFAAEWILEQGWDFYEPLLEVSLWIRVPLGLLAADALLYVWHRLNHRVPFLYRFHRVHHSDDSMDATTAVRFHPGEFLLSTGVSILQAAVVGPQREVWLLYELLVSVLVVFHHSEWRLPLRLEQYLHYLIVTPRSHTLHHSVEIREQDANFGTIFSFWDRLLSTQVDFSTRTDGAQSVRLGVEEPPRETLMSLLLSPFLVRLKKDPL